MPGFLQGFIEHKNQRRKNGHTAKDSKQHTLRHNDTKVAPHRKGHEAKRNKPGNRCNGTANYRGQCFFNGNSHSRFVVVASCSLLVVAMPKEDGIIHGNGKL